MTKTFLRTFGSQVFLLSRLVNNKNNVFFSEVPYEVFKRLIHSIKYTSWVTMSKHGIIGPFWLEDDDGRSQTVNKEHYMAGLNMFWSSRRMSSAHLSKTNWGNYSCKRSLIIGSPLTFCNRKVIRLKMDSLSNNTWVRIFMDLPCNIMFN